MKFNRTLKYASTVLLLLWLFMGFPEAEAARIAGEEDVTPSNPTLIQQRVIRPNPRTVPQKRPVPRTTVQSEEKTDSTSAVTGGKKSPDKQAADARFVTIDFDNVDIQIFIKFISELTGKNFVIDKAVKGKVTIVSPTKISVDEAYRVFESVLEVHGFTTVPAGKIIKVVPAVQARSKDIETRVRRAPIKPRDKVVTQLIHLRFADPNELRKLLAPFISKSSVIVAYPPTGMLIITDVLSNIKRLLRIIGVVDVVGIGEEVSVIPLQYASAAVMSKTLTSIFQTRAAQAKKGTPGSAGIKIVPDERTNVLIVLASEDDSERIIQLIKLLDQETPRGEGDIQVYYLQHANAEELSQVLMAIPTKQTSGAAKGKAPVVSREVQIVADKATNALVITAKKEDYRVLEDVIRKLDIPRRMVYLEALIMEVDTDKEFELGVQWQAADVVGSTTGGDGVSRNVALFGSSLAGDLLTPLATGFSFGVLGEAINIGGVSFPSIAAVVKALQTNTDITILSTPQIMTTDNEEAEIQVTKVIPFITSRDETDAGRAFTNFEYKDVGVTLNITPQINQERFVRLKLTQEVSQVIEEESSEGLPTTLKRLAKTTLIVKDGNTVVIGGLIDEVTSAGKTQTPCLGDITGLGWLFKSVSNKQTRQNLFIFITPHIIENPREAGEIYHEKRVQIEQLREGAVKLYPSKQFESESMRFTSLGYEQLQEKEYDLAEGLFQKALQLDTTNPYAILSLGTIYEVEGKKAEAIQMYQKVIEMNTQSRSVFAADPVEQGRKLTDIAKESLERLAP
jgi:general secretion pathway protein D